jgi:pantetheine-phosphate adenylyltransferase
MTIAVYAGSFDPITNGHLDIIERACKVFDEVIVAIGVNSSKKSLLTLEQKKDCIHRSIPIEIATKVEIASFEGLLVKFCWQKGAKIIIRGLRAVTDFEYEIGIAHANSNMAPDIDTFFLPTKPMNSFVSSSVVREIARYDGDLSHYVHPYVTMMLRSVIDRS